MSVPDTQSLAPSCLTSLLFSGLQKHLSPSDLHQECPHKFVYESQLRQFTHSNGSARTDSRNLTHIIHPHAIVQIVMLYPEEPLLPAIMDVEEVLLNLSQKIA